MRMGQYRQLGGESVGRDGRQDYRLQTGQIFQTHWGALIIVLSLLQNALSSRPNIACSSTAIGAIPIAANAKHRHV